MDRRAFLGSLFGLAATPLIKPKSFFFFGSTYQITSDQVRFNGPFWYGDGRRYLRGVVHLPHEINGRKYDGMWAVTQIPEVITLDMLDSTFKNKIVKKLNMFREMQISGSVTYTESPVINKFS